VAVAEPEASLYSFELEADPLQGAALGGVLNLGARLDAVSGCSGEQVLDQEALGGGADAVPALLRKQGDPDLEVAEGERSPGHPAGADAVGGDHGQERLSVAADEPVVLPPSFQGAGIVDPESEPLEFTDYVGIPT
jgi:hypothetical protein